MLRWISMLGGLLIMMGHHARCEALFYYFRLEDQVPENHLLRLIDKHISFEFVRQQLKDSYSEINAQEIVASPCQSFQLSKPLPLSPIFEIITLESHHRRWTHGGRVTPKSSK